MPTVADQIRAEIAADKARAAQEQTVEAQPGPTQAKADLERSRRVEGITQDIAGNQAVVDVPPGYLSDYLPEVIPDTKLMEHGATFGLDVPLSGLASGLNVWSHPGSSFGERYEAGEEARRRRLNISEAEAPLPVAQEVIGSIFSGGPAQSATRWATEQAGGRVLPAVEQSLLRTAAESGGVGAGTGFAHGVSTGEGDLSDRLNRGAFEALFGGTAGSVLGAGAQARASKAGQAPARVAAADEFGIPLTRGQATGDIAQQRAEQELIHGTKGNAPQQAMAAQQKQVEAARSGAVEDIRNRFSPYRGDTQEQSGALLGESIRRRAERLRAAGGGRIEQALESGAEIGAQPLRELPARLEARLAGPNPQVPEHYVGVNTPVAAEAMQRVRDFIKTVPDDPTARISLGGVNQLRRNLLSLNGQSDIDNRALGAIKSEVDDWINDIAGTDPALQTLRKGNKLYRQGSEIMAPRGKVTPAQKNVAKLAGEGAIGSDAVKMFNVNQRGGIGPEATRTARQIGEQFGANSPQMQRVRDIAVVSLLDGGPQQVANKIDSFLTSNRAAADIMFAPEQIAELERFRDVSRSLVSQEGAMNRGQSGYGPMKTLLRGALVGGGGLMAAQVGGDLNSFVMPILGMAAGEGVSRMAGQRAVNRALQPIPPSSPLSGVATNVARTIPGQLPEPETLARLMSRSVRAR